MQLRVLFEVLVMVSHVYKTDDRVLGGMQLGCWCRCCLRCW